MEAVKLQEPNPTNITASKKWVLKKQEYLRWHPFRTGIRLNSWMPRSLQKESKRNLSAPFCEGTDGDWQPELWLLPSHINPFESSQGRRADDGIEKIFTICGDRGQWPIFCWCCMDTRHVMGTLMCSLISWHMSKKDLRGWCLSSIHGSFCFWMNIYLGHFVSLTISNIFRIKQLCFLWHHWWQIWLYIPMYSNGYDSDLQVSSIGKSFYERMHVNLMI